MVYNL